jgi:hypothetical protein
MPDENEIKTFEIFCYRCNLQTTARAVATHVKTNPVNPLEAQTDPADTPYYITEYAIALCNKCDMVFLVESDFYEIPGEVCAPQGVSVLYPSDRKISTESIPKSASRAYAAAARSYQVGLYEPCVIMCRKCIEALCHELGTTKGNLKQRLEILQKSGHIDQKLMAWADELRLIGNDAAHDLEIDIEQVDAQDSGVCGGDFNVCLFAYSKIRRIQETTRFEIINRNNIVSIFGS